MNTAEQMVTVDRRRAILVVLVMAPAYMMPARGLREQIGLVGYAVSLDRIATDCAWLAEQGLIEWKNDVAILTDRGSDVATGRAQAPGVKRPAPGELA